MIDAEERNTGTSSYEIPSRHREQSTAISRYGALFQEIASLVLAMTATSLRGAQRRGNLPPQSTHVIGGRYDQF